ncbi:MAG: type IV secretory system conjugative DNA transfer family protein [Actinobacteria bacterium]|nr:type IV secretory system conjugative DNA transfer family protein [Actinomycetota bacterium]
MDGSDEHGPYLAAGLAAAALLALIWATGAIAGAVFGSGPAPVAPGETLAVALRLPSHLGDPRAAWPPPARGRLPGAVGVYVSFVLLALVLAGLAALVIRVLGGLELPSFFRGRDKPPSASWATGRELAPLRVPATRPRRLTLGRRGRALLAAEPGQSVIVLGPTQTHKTSGLVIPALLEWEGPVLCTSVKSDLLAPTLKRREALGEVWVFDPAQVTEPLGRARATPLPAAHDWPGALRVAHWLAGAAKAGAGDLQDADFWFANAEKLLAPLLFAANRERGSMELVVAWLDEGPEACEAAVAPILAESGEDRAARAFMATQNREERQRSSVYTTAETILAAFADPRVAEETAGADYTPQKLLAGPNTLYLISPRSEQERLRTVFSALIQELLALVEERSTARGGPIDPYLLLLLDECANIAPFPGLAQTASTGAGQGVQLLTVFQDLAQVKARFGNSAATILNNHRATLLGRGVSDVETLDYFSRLIGSGEFEQRSVSTQSGERGHRSQTEGDTYRELAPAHLLRQSEAAGALLVYGSLPPTTISLRPWYEEPALQRLRDRPGVEAGRSEEGVV